MCVHNQGVNRTEMPGMPGGDVTMLAATTAGGYKREQIKSSLFQTRILKKDQRTRKSGRGKGQVVINAHVGWGRSWRGHCLTWVCAARGGIQFCIHSPCSQQHRHELFSSLNITNRLDFRVKCALGEKVRKF
jgi:hypothetical protein